MKLTFYILTAMLLSGCVKTAHQRVVQTGLDKGVPIVVREIDSKRPNSAGGVDVVVGFVNASSKDMKYVYISVLPYNRVGDVVSSEIRAKTKAVLKQTGIIKAGGGNISHFSGSPVWPNVWYNRSIRCAEITGIKVVYMDGEEQEYSGDRVGLLIGKNVKNNCGL